MTTVEVREFWGLAVVEKDVPGGRTHRWWMEPTEGGDLSFVEEVIYFEDLEGLGDVGSGRVFIERDHAHVPRKVLEALRDRGFEGRVIGKNGMEEA